MRVLEEDGLRPQIVEVCRRLYDKDLIAATDGNVSARLSDGNILVTPSGTHKGFLNTEDLLVIDPKGHVLKGCRRPSSELAMHMAIYQEDPETMAVVHTHPPWTLALSLSGHWPSSHFLIESRLFLGKVSIVPFERPGTEALAQAVAKALHRGPVQILAHHGAVTSGQSLWEAFNLMECLEHTSRIVGLARMLGEPEPLPEN
ncbi:MAG: class II aldolase/adducin family protein [Nitrospiraceae bacterium]|nr:class II aldolase/adducin family protein [Nitrospiraceae bacterium]